LERRKWDKKQREKESNRKIKGNMKGAGEDST